MVWEQKPQKQIKLHTVRFGVVFLENSHTQTKTNRHQDAHKHFRQPPFTPRLYCSLWWLSGQHTEAKYNLFHLWVWTNETDLTVRKSGQSGLFFCLLFFYRSPYLFFIRLFFFFYLKFLQCKYVILQQLYLQNYTKGKKKLLKNGLENNLKQTKEKKTNSYCSILQSYCYMMQKHQLDIQNSVQFIQVYPHRRECKLCLRTSGIKTVYSNWRQREPPRWNSLCWLGRSCNFTRS